MLFRDPYLVELIEDICGDLFFIDPSIMMDGMRFLHLIGLGLGFGLALLADLMALRTITSPITRRDVDFLHFLHRTIAFGLALLWVSGLLILHHKTGFEVAQFTPKLVMKLAVVKILTLNAMVIGLVAMPVLESHLGQRFSDLGALSRLRLGAIAGLSFACWFGALTLGTFTQLKTMEFDQLEFIMSAVFAFGICGGLVTALAAPLLAGLGDLLANGARRLRRQRVEAAE